MYCDAFDGCVGAVENQYRRAEMEAVVDVDAATFQGFGDVGVEPDGVSSEYFMAWKVDLLKGASGQAVQNMNIMLGIDERTGLRLKPSAF